MRSCKLRLISFFLVVSLLLFLVTACGNQAVQKTEGELTVHFLNVGQADAIFIQLPTGQNMMIDAGNNDDGKDVVEYLQSHGVEKLHYVIGTHPHEDHIGGLDNVVSRFEIGKVYLPKVVHTTKTFEDLLAAIKKKGLKIHSARGGMKIIESDGLQVHIFAPNSDSYESLNNYSIVTGIRYGSTGFLFTGDAEREAEREMLAKGYPLKSDVLKVAHHGSHSSTSPAFLKKVAPSYAVISVGRDNDYEHPHQETLEKLKGAGVQIFRTDLQGTIKVTSDGEKLTFNKKPVNKEVKSSEVKISSLDLKGEKVCIINCSKRRVNLKGWKIVSERGTQIFTFPNISLEPGERINVVSGKNAKAGPGQLKWTEDNIWNNSGDTAVLITDKGDIADRYPE